MQAQESGTLLVSGIVYPDGTVSRPEVVRLADTGGARNYDLHPDERYPGKFDISDVFDHPTLRDVAAFLRR